MEDLNTRIHQNPPLTVHSLYEMLKSGNIKTSNVSMKTRKQILGIINSGILTDDEKVVISRILIVLANYDNLTDKLASDGPVLASICDKLLCYYSEKKYDDVIFVDAIEKSINASDRLKTQVGASLFGHIFNVLSNDNKVSDEVYSKCIKTLISAISKNRLNKILFAKRINETQINHIKNFLLSTSEPLGQVYSAELLWRIMNSMNGTEKISQIERIFGNIYNDISNITAKNFFDGIRCFVKRINLEMKNVYNLEIEKLSIGMVKIDFTNELDIGNSLIFWINQDAISINKNISSDLLVLNKEDIVGLIFIDRTCVLKVSDKYQHVNYKLFSKSQFICFELPESGDEVVIETMKKFGSIDLNDEVRKYLSLVAKQQKKKEVANKIYDEDNKVKYPKTDILEPKANLYHDITKFTKKAYKTPQIPYSKKKSKAHMSDELTDDEILLSSSENLNIERGDDDIEVSSKHADYDNTNDNDQRDTFEIPLISQSFCDSDEEEKLEKEKKRDRKRNKNASVSSTTLKHNFNTKRMYAPERWETLAFDNLQSFSSVIRTNLSSIEDTVRKNIQTTLENSIKKINNFMESCDKDLFDLMDNFNSTLKFILEDINKKQEMVTELGNQQREHIIQMQKDCRQLQKRAEDLLKRFESQKNALLAGQEKHIALFKEDIRSDINAAITSSKREYSKNKVHTLVNLLEEL